MSRNLCPNTSLVINGRFLTQKITGVQRFAIETVKAIDGLLNDSAFREFRNKVELLTPNAPLFPLQLRNISLRNRGRLQGHFWEQLELPFFCRGRPLLNLCALGPLVKRRQLTVIHDMAVLVMPRAFYRTVRLVYRIIIPSLARKSAVVATVSAFSQSEIARHFAIDHDRILVCSEGSEHSLAVESDIRAIEEFDLANKKFFLAVGVGGENKNLRGILDAFARLKFDVRLVIAGERNARIHPPTKKEDSDKVIYTGYITDAALRALYEGALALVYPSLYEGFGLPPLEAMTCGCPVISSTQPALMEISGGSALHVDAYDVQALSEAMRRLSEDENLRAELSRRGRARAAYFSWGKTGRSLFEACTHIST